MIYPIASPKVFNIRLSTSKLLLITNPSEPNANCEISIVRLLRKIISATCSNRRVFHNNEIYTPNGNSKITLYKVNFTAFQKNQSKP